MSEVSKFGALKIIQSKRQTTTKMLDTTIGLYSCSKIIAACCLMSANTLNTPTNLRRKYHVHRLKRPKQCDPAHATEIASTVPPALLTKTVGNSTLPTSTPSPSSPTLLEPQTYTAPSLVTTRLLCSPTAVCLMGVNRGGSGEGDYSE